jgi:hypothetical protein
MKKNIKKVVLIFMVPLLLVLFAGKVLFTLNAIYSERKHEKIKV